MKAQHYTTKALGTEIQQKQLKATLGNTAKLCISKSQKDFTSVETTNDGGLTIQRHYNIYRFNKSN